MSTSDKPEDLSQWSAVITAHRPWLDLRLKELWQARDLIKLLIIRDLRTSYKQTVLGPLWFFVQPVCTALIFTVVFGRIGKITAPGTPQFLFFMAGVTAWSYFAAALGKTATTFTGNSGLFGKVYFPRLAVPLSIVATSLITFAIQLLLFLAFFGISWYSGATVRPNGWLCFLPVLLLQMAALGLGAGCLISSLTSKYRDLAVAVGFGLQLGMYISCVIHPLSMAPAEWRWLMALNPMVPIIETFRYGFLGVGEMEIGQLAVSFVTSFVVLLLGLLVFNRSEQTAMDTA